MSNTDRRGHGQYRGDVKRGGRGAFSAARGRGRGRGFRGGPRVGRKGRSEDDSEGSPAQGGGGVNQLKAALRQTKRLLARDNVEPGKRQEAERRLIAIEQDIEAKQTQSVERNNAKRYHKIRFFERQKLVRRIKKLKKSLAEDGEEENETREKELQEARVLLNYVLHYPMSHKYVALFPSTATSSTDFDLATLFTVAIAHPQTSGGEAEPADATRKKAVEVRKQIEQEMEAGTISTEPEVELEKRGHEQDGPSSTTSSKRKRLDFETTKPQKKKQRDDEDEDVEADGDKDEEDRDDFFASDSEDEE
ncbi:hypothetical protein FA10DRAFT_105703 [Acaromyces ingoldii]|uniref:rRNA-processing protein EFG1 n=1 Tax=Acaromyces ingoldii TaxID=215250 RepID=A0A316YLQ7_9BASI|nr:hypothetical protein FA10DRAFT_105703 [Acaromyces ingoldii]PWN90131.1 hypothetical protein FA10DRAFT_105703 [Acaromyces ingoldii]